MTLLKWALIFLVVSLIAALFGFTGISAASADIARVLFFIFLVIFVVLLVLGLMAGRRGGPRRDWTKACRAGKLCIRGYKTTLIGWEAHATERLRKLRV